MPHDAMTIIHIASRILAFLSGCLATYMALFMYEKDEGHWQDRLEVLWVSLDDNATSLKEMSLADAALTGRVLFGDLSYILMGDDIGKPRFGFGFIMWLAARLVVVFFIVVKLLSPIAVRVTYSLQRFKFVTNKKLLGALSVLLFMHAFNLEQIGAKELLKLLG